MGAVGLLGMLALFTVVLVKVKRLIQAQRHLKDALALSGVFVGLLGVVLQNAVENVFEVPMMLVLFWGFVAVAMSYDGADPEAAEAADPEDEGA